MRLVKNARRYFPSLPIVVRAHSRTDAYEYAAMGVPAVREVFGSALDAAGRVLGALGYSEKEAESILTRFKAYDEQQIVENAPHRDDEKKLIALNEQGRRDIAELLAAEMGSAAQVDKDDARGDAERGGRERAADRL